MSTQGTIEIVILYIAKEIEKRKESFRLREDFSRIFLKTDRVHPSDRNE